MGKSRIVIALFAGALVGAPASVPAQTAQPVASRSGQPAVAASLVIEQFLRAANGNDLQGMARLFGTTKGSVWDRDPKGPTEQRMFALASVLRHDDYRIENAEIVPGRGEGVTRVRVRMVFGTQSLGVPFTLVRSRDVWLVEQIGVEEIMQRR